MNIRLVIGLGALTGAAIFLGQLGASAGPDENNNPGALGPDVIVGDLPAVRHWGTTGGIRAFSVGTTSCNVGDEDLIWQANNPLHPVVGQTMFRLHNGRLEQIGQSWLKHTFVTINNGICGTCNGHLGSRLGVGCSDPYSSSRNGGQARLGPKSEVNAWNGVFPYPYGICWQCTGNTIYKRLQVPQTEINDLNDLYFVEGHYITQDDAQFFQDGLSNGHNNASYRRITFSGSYSVSMQNTTQREIPAIFAWQDHGLGANTPDPDVNIDTVDIPTEGRIFVASKHTDLGGGLWRYDYAIQNLNSDRSVGSLTVPIATGTSISDTYFHDVDYHSGEPWDLTDWPVNIGANAVGWSTAAFNDDPDANAIRWNSMYTYSFTADAPPEMASVDVGIFKPGTPNSVSAVAWVPMDAGETICPDGPGDFVKQFGGTVSGDADALCVSDDSYLAVRQIAQFSPLLPFIRIETWAFSALDAVSELTYTIEGRVSAVVPGGQDPQTMRTFILNYTSGFELIDERGTGDANVDEIISHTQTTNPDDYINPGDGEVRIRIEAWDPGTVVSPNWFLYMDLYQVSLLP